MISRASCRRSTGTVVHRAEQFGELITADHKNLSEESESLNNHEYAMVVQDLATQWLRSHPCETKTSEETQKNLMKFLEPTRKPIVIYTDNSLEFGKSCEEFFWNHCTCTGLDKEWWADSMECYCCLRNIEDLWSDGKTPCERRFGMPFNGPVIPFGATVENHPISEKDISATQIRNTWELPKETSTQSVNTIPPDTEIHEQMTMTNGYVMINGYVRVCTTTSTLPTTVRPLWTIT